jgi:hypothetical protein
MVPPSQTSHGFRVTPKQAPGCLPVLVSSLFRLTAHRIGVETP